MLQFLILSTAIAAAFHAALSGRALAALERTAISIFLTLITLMYAPQISSLVLGTLSLWALLGLSVASVAALFLWERRSVSADGVRAAFRDVSGLGSGFWHAVSRDPYLGTLTFIAMCSTALVTWVFLNFQEFGWDGWTYHTAAMAWFNQEDGILATSSLMPWVASYPKNIEFLGLWIFKLAGVDQTVDGVNLLIHLAVLPFAYGVARSVGLRRYWATTAALVYFLTPLILVQGRGTYIDGAFADSIVMMLFFYLRWQDSDRKARILWSVLFGMSLGHLAQTKGSGLYVILIMGLLILAGELWKRRLIKRIPSIATAGIVTLLFGAGWYIKNWIAYSNPFYPLELAVPVLGYVLFPGQNVTEFDPNYLNHGSTLMLYLSRFAEISAAPLATGGSGGGSGAHFFFLGIPSVVLGFLTAGSKLRGLFVFGLIYFAVIPMSYFSRYSLVVTFLGALAFAHVAQDVLQGGLARRLMPAISVGTILLSTVQMFSVTWTEPERLTDPSAFFERDGFRRFALVSSRPGSSVAIGNGLDRHPDNPYWYFYFGPEWRNQVVEFDPANMKTYDFVVCNIADPCPLLEGFDRVMVEADVALFQRANTR